MRGKKIELQKTKNTNLRIYFSYKIKKSVKTRVFNYIFSTIRNYILHSSYRYFQNQKSF